MQNPTTAKECESYIMQILAPAGFTLDKKGWTGTPIRYMHVLHHAHSGFVYNLLVPPGWTDTMIVAVELRTENYNTVPFYGWEVSRLKPLDEMCAALVRLNSMPEAAWANLRLATREKLQAEADEKDAAEKLACWEHNLRKAQKANYAASEAVNRSLKELNQMQTDYSGS